MHPTLVPTEKPEYPFQAWSIDLITNMKPSLHGNAGGDCIIVCIDYFTNWIDIGAL